jgi:hypothetical protein
MTLRKAMPRFKPKGVLERSALSDFWKHTLSQIPTQFGRLVYCSSLRDRNSGAYRHHGLIASFGRDESEKAMRQSHEDAFAEWLALSLANKAGDFHSYLEGVEEPARDVVPHWLTSGQLHTIVPSCALPMEHDLFVFEMEALLETLRNGENGGRVSPGSSRRP